MADEIPPRPIPLCVQFDNMPSELCHHDLWVLWRYEWKECNNSKPGKWDKPPYTPEGKFASATNPDTWSSFDRVRTTYVQGQSLSVDHKKPSMELVLSPVRMTNQNYS